ncbi:unnamed protein product [Rotaria sordida]|uniref:Death domain-containing protein n=1 Tax=Rotaria sordida TaxID=392033 RepID=A0A813VXY4_9BILA|nr:unnamed protein product [Rotaria sordida]CAF3698055.1 unnamed protein product [Rotaria sordida]
MPVRPVSAGKKGGKKSSSPTGKKGKKKSKSGLNDPHQEEIEGLIREREEIRSKLNLICSRIMENINMDDYQIEIDLTKQQPSDISVDHLLSMIDEICYYRIAFLNLFQEADDNEKIPVQKKITQLSIDEPDMFRKRLTPDQRLTFVTRERDVWKENAQLLQIMYATIVDQIEMNIFKKPNDKTEDILQHHRLNLEDVCLIFSSPRVRSINDAQKLRAKKTLDDVLSGLRDQHAFFDLDQPQKQQEIIDNTHILSNDEIPSKSYSLNRDSTNERRSHQTSSAKRNVSFADEVNVFNDDDETYINQTRILPSTIISNEQNIEDNLSPSAFMNASSFIIPSQYSIEEKYIDSDYYSISSSSSFPSQQYDIPSQIKYNLPSKYRLPLASEVLVNKMDSNLRMLIIKELSKSGHNERPLSRMSSAYGSNSSDSSSRQQFRRQSTSSSSNGSSEWVELARLIGIDESEIDHWLSQNLQYPAGRVISAWCNYASPQPTVAELHSLVSSKELNRPDLARYIETMYIIE